MRVLRSAKAAVILSLIATVVYFALAMPASLIAIVLFGFPDWVSGALAEIAAILFGVSLTVCLGLAIWGRTDDRGIPKLSHLRWAWWFGLTVSGLMINLLVGGVTIGGKGTMFSLVSTIINVVSLIVLDIVMAPLHANAFYALMGWERTDVQGDHEAHGKRVMDRGELFQPTRRAGFNLPTSIAAPSPEELSRMDSAPHPAWRIEGQG